LKEIEMPQRVEYPRMDDSMSLGEQMLMTASSQGGDIINAVDEDILKEE
jgi:hypothetical protein